MGLLDAAFDMFNNMICMQVLLRFPPIPFFFFGGGLVPGHRRAAERVTSPLTTSTTTATTVTCSY
jgi:hypothetical protein